MPTGASEFVYDEQGHMLGEYNDTGAMVDETVYLGDLPVGILVGTGGSAATYQVSPDNIGAPIVITDQTGNQVWTWDHLAFGDSAPNQNPSGLGVFNYNLRFPGQYADTESGLSYNYFRDYNPELGRYVESDPLGLLAGTNTYNYTFQNPLSFTDPEGKQVAQAVVGVGLVLIGAFEAYEKVAHMHADNVCTPADPTGLDTPEPDQPDIPESPTISLPRYGGMSYPNLSGR